jgi:enoyl-CoA hydratase/carnithine racemase
VNKVVPREQLEQAAAEMAAQINQHDPQVVGAIKKMVNRVIRADQAAMLDREELEKRRFNDLVSEQKAMAKGRDILPGKG